MFVKLLKYKPKNISNLEFDTISKHLQFQEINAKSKNKFSSVSSKFIVKKVISNLHKKSEDNVHGWKKLKKYDVKEIKFVQINVRIG